MSILTIRSSRAGDLMTDKQGTGITDKQLATIKLLQERKEGFMRGDPGVKPLTQNMVDELSELIKKRDAPFELSDTAKTMLFESWVEQNRGVRKLVTSKFMEKGLFSEEDELDLLGEVDGRFYTKNTTRVTKEFGDLLLTGECDNEFEHEGKKVVQDMKASWDVFTFGTAKWDSDYEWQGRCYMELYNADEFWLRYCLVDCPFHIMEGEIYKFKLYNGIIDDSTPENQALIEQKMKTLIYSDNPLFSDPKERVKTYKIKRNKDIFQKFLDRVPAAKAYWDSLTLNIRMDEEKFNKLGYYD